MTTFDWRSNPPRGPVPDVSSISRRRLLQLAAPAFASAGLLTHTDVALSQQLTEAGARRAALGKAFAWVNNREEGMTSQRMSATAIENLKKTLAQDIDTAILIGGNLTRMKQAYQIWVHADGFFAFPLTAAQARMLDLKEDSMTTWTYPRHEVLALPFAADLQSLNVRDKVKNKARLSGSVRSRSLDDEKRDYHVRVLYRYDKYTTQHTWPLGAGALADDLITIDFEASISGAYVGPLAVFVSIMTMEGPNQAKVARSNTVGALINVVPR